MICVCVQETEKWSDTWDERSIGAAFCAEKARFEGAACLEGSVVDRYEKNGFGGLESVEDAMVRELGTASGPVLLEMECGTASHCTCQRR